MNENAHIPDLGQATALTVSRDSGALSLAMMGEAEFESRLEALKVGQGRMRRIQQELLVNDEDYGVIPGTKKPTLLKPGAEKLCAFYGLVATFEPAIQRGDGVTEPPLRVLVTCTLHHRSIDGPVVAQGIGAANAWERKYRYRSGQRACPACGLEGSIRRSQYPDRSTGDKGWYCHAKAGGCGAQFQSSDARVADQQVGQVENPDLYDVENTLVKMASKRAYIDGTLRATATSGLFTQDLEEQHEPPSTGEDEVAPKPRPALREPQRKSSSATTATSGGPNNTITDAQRKGFYALCKGANRSDEDVKAHLVLYGFSSTAQITRDVYEELCSWAKSDLRPGTRVAVGGEARP